MGPVARTITIATGQHGVVSRSQLLQAGVSRHWIDLRLKRGWLESLHRGVYRVGPVGGPHYREMAALLAYGSAVVISHRSAAAIWEILPPPEAALPVMVSTTRSFRGRSSGIQVYRARGLGPDEISSRHGLHLTTPARTLFDLASTVSMRDLELAMTRADREGLLEMEDLEALLALYPRRPGRPRIRAILGNQDGSLLTRSEAEERFLALIRKVDLPIPQMNALVNGIEVDALWREERLVVEVDGFAYHSTRSAFERDRYRDGILVAAGYRVLRITWRQLTREPEILLVRLTRALAGAGE